MPGVVVNGSVVVVDGSIVVVDVAVVVSAGVVGDELVPPVVLEGVELKYVGVVVEVVLAYVVVVDSTGVVVQPLSSEPPSQSASPSQTNEFGMQ